MARREKKTAKCRAHHQSRLTKPKSEQYIIVKGFETDMHLCMLLYGKLTGCSITDVSCLHFCKHFSGKVNEGVSEGREDEMTRRTWTRRSSPVGFQILVTVMPSVSCEESWTEIERERKLQMGKKTHLIVELCRMSEHTAGHFHAYSVAGYEDLPDNLLSVYFLISFISRLKQGNTERMIP